MVDTYHVTVDSVEPVPGLGADQGWVGMTVQFLIDAAKAGSQHFVFGRARFAPVPARVAPAPRRRGIRVARSRRRRGPGRRQ